MPSIVALERRDPVIAGLIREETLRQAESLTFIASATIQSDAVLEALSTPFAGVYGEGYPGARFYNGVGVVDRLEREVQERANRVFGTRYANVQPYSGSPANFIAESALVEPGGIVLAMDLSHGGHLTHGSRASETSRRFHFVHYGVRMEEPDKGWIDYEQMRQLAQEHHPKLIVTGATAYSRQIEFERVWEIAQEVGAFVMADIAHYAGLIAAEVYPNPAKFSHVMTGTWHKTMGGPRAGFVLVTQEGMDRDPELPKRVDTMNFPRLNGGPHFHTIAAAGVALGEAETEEFRYIQRQTVINAQALAEGLMKRDIPVLSGGTDSHMFVAELKGIAGATAADALEEAGIVVSKSTLPGETNAINPSGFRMGTSVVTRMGMGPDQMEKIAEWTATVIEDAQATRERLGYELSQERGRGAAKVRAEILANMPSLGKIRAEVRDLALAHPFSGSIA